MSNLQEQFSAARKAQLEAQLDAFRHFSGQAVENTEKLIALNLKTTRASVEKSTAAIQQLLSAKDPRDLFALTSHSRDSFDTLLAYSRALFGIAGSTRVEAPSFATVPSLAAPGAARVPANDEAHGADDEEYSEDYEVKAGEFNAGDEEAGAEQAHGASGAASPATPDTHDEPIIVSLRAASEQEEDPLPLAEATPIARAAASIAGAAHETPAAAPLAADDAIQIDVSGIKPVDAAPPPAPATYPNKQGNGKPGEGAASKGARRK